MPTAMERRVILDAVYLRDGGCVAPLIDPEAGLCRDRWGHVRHRGFRPALTFDHLRDAPGGFKPCFCVDHLTCICYGHHLGSMWATSNRPELREYHRRLSAAVDAPFDSPGSDGDTTASPWDTDTTGLS